MRPFRFALVAVVLLSLLACDERDCVTETLSLAFRGNEVDITSRVEVTTPDAKEHPALADRAAAMRMSLTLGTDPWTSRFALLRPSSETFQTEKKEQQLVAVERSATIPRHELGRFLADTAVTINFFDGQEWEELTLTAGESRRATSKQKQQVAQAFERASTQYATYLAAVDDLYVYLRSHPDRSEIVWEAFLGDEDHEPPLHDEDEAVLIKAIIDSDPLRTLQVVDPQEALSLDAMTRLVYDPFPADITLVFPGEILESDGFEKIAPKSVVVPRAGLVDAVRSLGGRWISPDPLAIFMTKELTGDETPIDTAALAREPLRSARPSAAVIRQALEEALRPEPRYRVRWRKQA